MKKVIAFVVHDLTWVKRHLASLLRHHPAESASRPHEHHGLYCSLVSHDRHVSGRLF